MPRRINERGGTIAAMDANLPLLEAAMTLAALAAAAAFRPWSTVAAAELRTPWLALLVSQTVLWSLQLRLLPAGIPPVSTDARSRVPSTRCSPVMRRSY